MAGTGTRVVAVNRREATRLGPSKVAPRPRVRLIAGCYANSSCSWVNTASNICVVNRPVLVL